MGGEAGPCGSPLRVRAPGRQQRQPTRKQLPKFSSRRLPFSLKPSSQTAVWVASQLGRKDACGTGAPKWGLAFTPLLPWEVLRAASFLSRQSSSWRSASRERNLTQRLVNVPLVKVFLFCNLSSESLCNPSLLKVPEIEG